MAETSPPPIPVAPTSDNNGPKSSEIKSQILQLTLTGIQTTNSDENPCVICLETISSPSTAIPCAHSNFDFLCLVSWLQEQPFCPLCKASVTDVRYTDPDSQKESIYTVPSPTAKPDEPLHVAEGWVAIPEISATAWLNRLRRQRNRRLVVRRSDNINNVDQALERRCYIYRHNLYSLHIGSSPHTSYSPSVPPPEILSSTPHLLSKARLFLRRELQVFFPSSTPPLSTGISTFQNREFLLEYVIAILKTIDLQSESGAGQAYNMLQHYILLPENGEDRTSLFVHELKNWMRWRGEPVGNVSLESWDRGVQYPSLGEGNNKRRYYEDGDGEGREWRGYSWQDETGDHWRPVRPDGGHNEGRNNRTGGHGTGNERQQGRPRRRRVAGYFQEAGYTR